MHRKLYLVALFVLQVALIGWVAPPLAQVLRIETAPGLAPAGWPATLQLVALTVTVIAAALALAFPVVALVRHCTRGPVRFVGLPDWATIAAACGAAALCVGLLTHWLTAVLPVDARFTVILVAKSVAAAGLALATAGVLCAELLRRSVVAPRDAVDRRRERPARIEVTHPPELRTRVA